jgi:hypothetical protein
MSGLTSNDQEFSSTLNLSLLKMDKSTWNENELIDLENTNHKRTLSGLLSEESEKIKIMDGDKEIAFAEGEYWSMVPLVINKIADYVTYFQNNPEDINNKTCVFAKAFFPGKNDEDNHIGV